MLTSGDVVDLDLGLRQGREAGSDHPSVVITAQRVLDAEPSVVQIVPLTSTLRAFQSEVIVEPDEANGLEERSAAQCQHVRAVAHGRIRGTRGNVGPMVLRRIRETLGVLVDLPAR